MQTKIRRLLLVAGFAGVFILFGWFMMPVRTAQSLERAWDAHRRLDQSLKMRDYQSSVASKAALESQIASLQRALEKSAPAKNAPAEIQQQFKKWKGEFFYLKALSLRDGAYALAGSNGKPLPETPDTSAGDTFRNFTYISDKDKQAEAVLLLRNAAALLADRREVLQDALLTELALRPFNWVQIRSLSEAKLALDSEDRRCLYLLARLEFEQPMLTGVDITDTHRRDAGRVGKSLELLNRLKKLPGVPIWRMIHLEAKIHLWMWETALHRNDKVAAERSRASLEDTLWGAGAALKRALAGDGIAPPMSPFDVEGTLDIFRIAAKCRLLAPAKQDRARLVLEVAQASGEFTKARMERESSDFSPVVLASNDLNLLIGVRPAIHSDLPKDWSDVLEKFAGRWRTPAQSGQLPPALVAAAAELFLLESRQSADSKKPVSWDDEARNWLKSAMAHFSGEAQLPLQMTSAYLKITAGFPEEVSEHLKTLSIHSNAQVRTNAELLQCLSQIQLGELKKAQETMQSLSRSLNPGQATRLNTLLLHLYRGLGKTDRLLPIMRENHEWVRDVEKLSPADLLWIADWSQNRDALTSLMAETHFQLARDKYARHLKEKPSQDVPASLIDFHEREATALAKKLPNDSTARTRLRQVEYLYLKATHQSKRAETLAQQMLSEPCCAGWMAILKSASDRNELADTQKSLSEQLSKRPNNPAARLALILVHWERNQRNEAAVALSGLDVDETIRGDLLFAEQIDQLAQLGSHSAQTETWRKLLPIFEAAVLRYPFDARVALALGQARAIVGEKQSAALPLRRALNLAREAPSQLSESDRNRVAAGAEQELLQLKRR